jgi:predicted adenylyl cyclase CyaB
MQKTGTKNIEVEIRTRLDDIDSFRNTLKECGAEFTMSVYICDVYFCNRAATKVGDVEMDAVGSYSLRLRRTKKGDEKEHVTLNTKIITNHGDHNAWEEHEIEVSDFPEAAKILNTTEFKPFFKLEKTRHIYRFDDMEVCVEDISDFGGAVEVEIMCAPGDEARAKEKIRDFLRQCNIGEDKIVPKSITNIIMKERAFKQEIFF